MKNILKKRKIGLKSDKVSDSGPTCVQFRSDYRPIVVHFVHMDIPTDVHMDKVDTNRMKIGQNVGHPVVENFLFVLNAWFAV